MRNTQQRLRLPTAKFSLQMDYIQRGYMWDERMLIITISTYMSILKIMKGHERFVSLAPRSLILTHLPVLPPAPAES